MIPIAVTAILQSPVHLGARNTAANFLNGLGHIPGRSLLGASAWAWIDAGRSAESFEFSHHFVSGAVSWGDLHPVPINTSTGAVVDSMPEVIPRSVRVCKLSQLKHGFIDTLVVAARSGECGHTEGRTSCNVGIERLEGVFVSHVDGAWLSSKPHREHHAHDAICFGTGTSKPGALYSREALQEGQSFRGEIRCVDEPTAEAVSSMLRDLPLAVGSGRSRSYGRLEICTQRGEVPALSANDVRGRSDSIHAQREPAPPDLRYFKLTAASPWCLREPNSGFSRTLTGSWIARVLGVEEERAEVLGGDARCEARSGWDGAAGLPNLAEPEPNRLSAVRYQLSAGGGPSGQFLDRTNVVYYFCLSAADT